MANLANLPLDLSDAATAVMVDAALDWVARNTTVEIDQEAELPANVKLFVVKYCDLFGQTAGVASESLGGMSQSFTGSGSLGMTLAALARQLFGDAYTGGSRFIVAGNRWR